jgi:hypothetical protein
MLSFAWGRWPTAKLQLLADVEVNMRTLARTVGVVVVLLLASPAGSAVAGSPAKPLVFHPHWRLVVKSGLLYAAVSDRYVAFVTGLGGSPVTLLDDQTGARTALSPPNCSTERSDWGTWDQPLFLHAPWLLVSCGQVPPSGRETYDLYNIATGQWAAFPLSAQCQGKCQVVDIGKYWVKILTDEGIVTYGPSDYYLQNITTGQFERDPAGPGGTVYDDLSAPSGLSALCSPLRYPQAASPTWPPGPVRVYRQFALMYQAVVDQTGDTTEDSYHLRRCGSKLDMILYRQTYDGSPGPYAESQPFGNSRAVIQTPDGVTIRGWFLPSLRRFTIPTHLLDYIAPIGLTDRSIYVHTSNKLWAATLPSPPRRFR